MLLGIAVPVLGVICGVAAQARLDRPPPGVFTGPMLAGPPSHVVTAYQKVLGPAAQAWVLDPGSGRYLPTPYATVLPSPDGGRALVQPRVLDDADWRVTSRADLLAGRTGQARPLPRLPGADAPGWTPDGAIFQAWRVERTDDRLPVTSPVPAGFRFVDPATLRATSTVPLPDGAYSSPLYLADVALGPDGRSVMVFGDATTFGHQQVWLFDLRGHLARTLRTAVQARGDSQARPVTSPDGRYVQASDGQHILDLSTGQALPPGDGMALGFLQAAGWYDSTRCIVQVPDRLQGRLLVLDVLSGHIVESIPIPNDIGIGRISIGRLAYYGPDSGPLVF